MSTKNLERTDRDIQNSNRNQQIAWKPGPKIALIAIGLLAAVLFTGCAQVKYAANEVGKKVSKPEYEGGLFNPYCTDYELNPEGSDRKIILYAGVFTTFIVESPRFGDDRISAVAKPLGSEGCNDDRVILLHFDGNHFHGDLSKL